MGQRNKNGGDTGSRNFCHSECSCSADNQISPPIGCRHIGDKLTYVYLGHAKIAIGHGNLILIALARLMTHRDIIKQGQGFRNNLIQHSGTQTTTNDENVQRTLDAIRLFFGAKSQHIVPNRIADHFCFRTRTKRASKTHQYFICQPGKQAIGHSCRGILLMQDKRNTTQPSGNPARACGIPTHTKHKIGFHFANQRPSLKH